MRKRQTGQNQGFILDFVCPKAYKVRRAANLACSIKHKTGVFLIKVVRLPQSFELAITLKYHVKALIFTVLYGLRFFTSPYIFLARIIQCFIRLFNVYCDFTGGDDLVKRFFRVVYVDKFEAQRFSAVGFFHGKYLYIARFTL